MVLHLSNAANIRYIASPKKIASSNKIKVLCVGNTCFKIRNMTAIMAPSRNAPKTILNKIAFILKNFSKL